MSISNKPLFIAVAGTLNAGKDSVGKILTEDYGFLHISTSDMIRAMKKNVFGDTSEALVIRNDPFINELREKNGPGFLIGAAYEKWQAQSEKYPNGFVATGLRAIGEAEKIKDIGGVIIFVDASSRLRYERSILRARDKNDQKSYQEFIDQERREIDVDPNDKTIPNLSAMKNRADIIIENDFNDIQSLRDYIKDNIIAHL